MGASSDLANRLLNDLPHMLQITLAVRRALEAAGVESSMKMAGVSGCENVSSPNHPALNLDRSRAGKRRATARQLGTIIALAARNEI
jgi:hypothetical protein